MRYFAITGRITAPTALSILSDASSAAWLTTVVAHVAKTIAATKLLALDFTSSLRGAALSNETQDQRPKDL
jgi:hypothetical protein